MIILKEPTDDIFESSADILVNAVNARGVMGAGLAKQFADRYPEMYNAYKRLCGYGFIGIGKGHIWYSDEQDQGIFNLVTMEVPGSYARIQDIVAGLIELCNIMEYERLESVAIPALGCGIGRLPFDVVYAIIEGVFYDSDATIEVYPPR